MKRIAPGPHQESVWDYPRPPRLEPSDRRIRVVAGGATVADTAKAYRLLETSHPPGWYLPPGGVAEELLVPVEDRSFCEFKGIALYFDVVTPERRFPKAAWSYPDPTPAFAAIRDHFAFYPAGWTPASWTTSGCRRSRGTSTADGSPRTSSAPSREGRAPRAGEGSAGRPGAIRCPRSPVVGWVVTMRIHHLSCGTFCPRMQRWLQGSGGLFAPAEMPCHCLLVETESSGLVLVDTGLGLQDVRNPVERIGASRYVMKPILEESNTAARQVEALGFSRQDVRHIVLTHLDFDHAGGLGDFPGARVHLLADEKNAALDPRTRLERSRYRDYQWDHDPIWCPYEPTGEPWRGFEAVRALEALPPEILMLPLPGHTRGHAGVAIDVGGDWLIHAGDAYFHRGEMEQPQRCPGGMRLYQKMIAVDSKQRLANLERLRQLRYEHDDVQVFCAHDPDELRALQSVPAP